MELLVKNIRLAFNADFEDNIDGILRKKGISGVSYRRIFKRSVDARKKNNIIFVYTVLCNASGYPQNDGDIEIYTNQNFADSVFPRHKKGVPPVIVGFGPCGMFCGLILAKFGYEPIIIERGSDIDTRKAKVDDFFSGGKLDTRTNVQFGEGGAGTFSDGKLMTRVKDSRCSYILSEMVRHGAPEEILYNAKPHIGTDRLYDIVKSIRKEIILLGGKVLFDTALTDIKKTSGGYEITLNDTGKLFSDSVFLASGHSAHDIYYMLMKNGILVEPKDYSVGFRIEHLQSDVDRSLYGNAVDSSHAHLLPKGEYSLSYRKGDRGVYSFCMCPGGLVVPSASEENTIVTNGMSRFARDGINANSAICVSVLKSDYGNTPDGSIKFRQHLEQSAFNISGDYRAPFQTAGDFLEGKPTFSDASHKIYPSYPMGVTGCDIGSLFPGKMTSLFREGLGNFARKFDFFSEKNAPMTAVETRTSSPCRIPREDNLQIKGMPGFYPCGEGAGYAGGITSAALDGIRCAVNYIENE
ncbi:MAG: hypothetical protein IJO74_04295 [Clostridia bacterium]|nr:hypothetical protein [Clostridia bacterium]